MSNNSIYLYRVAIGSKVEVEKPPTTVTTEVPSQETSDQDSSTVTLSQEDPQRPYISNYPQSDTSDWGLFSKL